MGTIRCALLGVVPAENLIILVDLGVIISLNQRRG
jgi:hypothetical protein